MIAFHLYLASCDPRFRLHSFPCSSRLFFFESFSLVAPPDDEKSSMLLVMRVLSIVPLNFKVSGALLA